MRTIFWKYIYPLKRPIFTVSKNGDASLVPKKIQVLERARKSCHFQELDYDGKKTVDQVTVGGKMAQLSMYESLLCL